MGYAVKMCTIFGDPETRHYQTPGVEDAQSCLRLICASEQVWCALVLTHTEKRSFTYTLICFGQILIACTSALVHFPRDDCICVGSKAMGTKIQAQAFIDS